MPQKNPYKDSEIGPEYKEQNIRQNGYLPYDYDSSNKLTIIRKLVYTFLSIFCLILGFFIGLLIAGEFSSSGLLGFFLTFGGAIFIIVFLIYTVMEVWKSREKKFRLIILVFLNAIIPLIWVIAHKYI